MRDKDPIGELLRELGRPAGEDALGALEDLVRGEPSLAPRLLDQLLAALAKTRAEEEAGLLAAACGLVRLAANDPKRASEQLQEALSLLGKAHPRTAARASLALARCEAALGDKKAARARLGSSIRAILDVPQLAGDLKDALAAAGEHLASELVAHRRASERGADRIEIVARLAHALNSSIAGTSEPLYAILRAIIEETGAERGFIMLQGGGQLRFELGLARDGRALGPESFNFSSTVVERTLEEGKAILVPDLARTLPFAEASSARDLGLRAALAAPLRVDRKRPGALRAGAHLESVKGIAGVLYVDATVAASFGEGDARFLETLSDFAVIALRAARASAEKAPFPKSRGTTRSAAPVAPAFGGLVTRDPALLEVSRTVERAAASGTNVLLRGESGTGKELLARALHAASRGAGAVPEPQAARAPFVAIDCGAIPDDLLHGELFGHEAHAFTGAGAARAGLIEQADGGTLFLDEVGDATPAFQAAILRALQEGEVRRLGATSSRPVRVRVVSATNRDLRALVEAGTFRHDLLYRIAALEIRIPPLRERAEDISLLVDHFLARREEKPEIEPEALARLEEHGWPGNVRELENALAAAEVIGEGTITLAAVDEVLASAPPLPAAAPARRTEGHETLEALEKRAIADRLERFGWNQVQAAASLGIDRNTLRRKVMRHGIVRGA